MRFVVISAVTDIEVIAQGRRIRDLGSIERRYGKGRWRKLKGRGTVQLANGDVRLAELHWYEAHGIGRRQIKIKALMDE